MLVRGGGPAVLRVWLGPIILRCAWRDPKRSGFASRRLVSCDAVELADYCYAQVDGLKERKRYLYSHIPPEGIWILCDIFFRNGFLSLTSRVHCRKYQMENFLLIQEAKAFGGAAA